MQHINFISQLDRVVEPPFSAKQQVQLLAALVAVLLVTYVALFFQQASWSSDLQQLKAEQSALKKQVAALNAKKAAEENNPQLKTELARLESAVKFRRQLIAGIDPNDQQESNGFAEHLDGLARQQVVGLWFTEINLSQRGEQMSLHGYTQKPEFVPQYLQKLSAEQVFTGKQFNVLRLTRAENMRNTMRFAIKTHDMEAVDE